MYYPGYPYYSNDNGSNCSWIWIIIIIIFFIFFFNYGGNNNNCCCNKNKCN